jgi:internalin A
VGLAEIPISLRRLTSVTNLDLSGNRLPTLPDFLFQLIGLDHLYLWGTQLTFLPEGIGKLTRLRYITVVKNGLKTLPESLSQLTQLEELWLQQNKLTTLPGTLGRLAGLNALGLSENPLAEVPQCVSRLAGLRRLLLQDTRLTQLPDWIHNLTALEELDLRDNESLGLPTEVLLNRKPAEVLNYYASIRAGARPLHEAKLILLGRGEVGKTCVVNRLVQNKFKSTEMTKGIAITQWPVTVGKDTVRLHVWDFGGQEIQHATHQFFLTERSLYLVVLNGRAGDEENDAEYWLKFVKTFGASSPTIVVLNKFMVQPFQVNRRALQEKYPFIRAFVETDCKPNTKNGRTELIKQIKSAIGGMEHVRAAFPKDWFRIKERLAKMKEPFISFDEYRKICAELGEKEAQAQERLAGFLDDLGIALNFREDQQLREETVLNPHWITEGVYQIITSKVLAERKGELRLADLGKIFSSGVAASRQSAAISPRNSRRGPAEAPLRSAYPPRMHQFLIELMRKFELCFSYHDDPAEHRYLVPELLGKEKPALKEPFLPEQCLNFRYDYRLMPEGLLPRFITRTHTMSEPGERWRTGVVLRWESCRALVEADKQERQVLVRVLGELEKRTRLLAVIRQNFDEIHKEMREFKPTEWVALEEHPEQWISHSKLEAFEQNQKPEFEEHVDSKLITVNVNELLEQTDVPGARGRDETRGADSRSLKLFISYAHLDEKWRVRLKPNLELLQREGLIEIWSDRQIVASSLWDDEIQRKVAEADLYLFLMSTNLLNSGYVRDKELPAALKRHEQQKAGFVPVVVQRCSWEQYVGHIQGLPTGGKPLSDWRPYDNGCFDVEVGLRKAIVEVRKILKRA